MQRNTALQLLFSTSQAHVCPANGCFGVPLVFSATKVHGLSLIVTRAATHTVSQPADCVAGFPRRSLPPSGLPSTMPQAATTRSGCRWPSARTSRRAPDSEQRRWPSLHRRCRRPSTRSCAGRTARRRRPRGHPSSSSSRSSNSRSSGKCPAASRRRRVGLPLQRSSREAPARLGRRVF